MKAFIDTSSLFKKYVEEPGSIEFNHLLSSVHEIIVAPITKLEFYSVIERRLREKMMRPVDAKWIEKEFTLDYDYFSVVEWNENIISGSIRLIRKYQLKTLDSIQLSAALLAAADLFITSDKRLYQAGSKEFKTAKFI